MNAATALPLAHGPAPLRGILRAVPEDFFVDEDLGFAPDGSGEHVFVRIEKRGANTDWVARQLARFAGVGPGAVSYAGMKDRHAVTRQTFSVHLPGKRDPDWMSLRDDEFHVLDVARHRRKLPRGVLKGNAFRIVVRDAAGDVDAVAARIDTIRREGVPNYFGEQRFGSDGRNLERARALFGGARVPRHEHGILLSAARSYLFNRVLAERVRGGSWNRALPGDVWMLAGSNSIFGPEPLSDDLLARQAGGDIAPTGPLWGAGELRTTDAAAAIEQAIGASDADLLAGLAANGLRQERRSLVLAAPDLAAEWLSPTSLQLSFSLKKGSYATVIIREIVDSNSPMPDEDA
jgi:tRNA pseudouridine13 synthase